MRGWGKGILSGVLVLVVAAACSRRQPTAIEPTLSWRGSLQVTQTGGQSIRAADNVFVGVEGLVFRSGSVLDVEISPTLPPGLQGMAHQQASDVVTLRFKKSDLLELAPDVLENMAYGVVIALPLRRPISEEWGNVVVLANNRYFMAMPYVQRRVPGEEVSVRLPGGFLRGIATGDLNEVTIFFAESEQPRVDPKILREGLPPDIRDKIGDATLEALWDPAGYPFRLEISGGEVRLGSNRMVPPSAGIVAGNRYGVFDPVAVFFSNGLNIAGWPTTINPYPCTPGFCGDVHKPLNAIYQAIRNQASLDERVLNKLVGFYYFKHSGHQGFFAPANALWKKFEASYVDGGSLDHGDLRGVVLTGFSMGGLVSRAAAAEHPFRTIAIGSINTPHLGSIIADLVTYNDGKGDLIDTLLRYVQLQMGWSPSDPGYVRFERELNSNPHPFYPMDITDAYEVFRYGSVGGVTLAPASAVKPLLYQEPANKPYIRVCVGSAGQIVDFPDPRPGDEDVVNLHLDEVIAYSGGEVKRPLVLYMTGNLPERTSWPPQKAVLWILGRFMGALEYSVPSCTGLYPSSDAYYTNDGVVSATSGLFRYSAYRDPLFSVSEFHNASSREFHLDAPENPTGYNQWADAIAGKVVDFLRNRWMSGYSHLYEIAWEYLFSTASIDLEFYALFRDNTLTLDYLLSTNSEDGVARRWPEFYTYSGDSRGRNGLRGTGLSRNAGPEGIALLRGQTTKPRVYLVAVVKNPPLVSLDLKAKFHIFEKPQRNSLGEVRDTLIESSKVLTRWTSDLFWVIGAIDENGNLIDGVESKWVGVRELDYTTQNGNLTCEWKVYVLDYQDPGGSPVIENYPILRPGLGAPVKLIRCTSSGSGGNVASLQPDLE